jgi:hypothetical protein
MLKTIAGEAEEQSGKCIKKRDPPSDKERPNKVTEAMRAEILVLFLWQHRRARRLRSDAKNGRRGIREKTFLGVIGRDGVNQPEVVKFRIGNRHSAWH